MTRELHTGMGRKEGGRRMRRDEKPLLKYNPLLFLFHFLHNYYDNHPSCNGYLLVRYEEFWLLGSGTMPLDGNLLMF
jgi:hypothetical protein